MKRFGILAGAALAALAYAASAEAATKSNPFDGVTVFGDSLSDDGNIALATGVPKLTGTAALQKFTTNPGDVTVGDLATSLGLTLTPSVAGGTDYAWGGAGVLTNSPGTPSTVPTLTTQITSYLASHSTLDAHTLYTVWGGANDIFYHATSTAAYTAAQAQIAALPSTLTAAQLAAYTAQINAAVEAAAGVTTLETSTQAGTAVLTAAQQEVTLINELHSAGAKYVVVFNLPDIGQTPQATAEGATAAAALTQLSTGYNTVLNQGLAGQTGIVPVNTYALIHEVVANPAAFGLVNVTTPACTTASSLTCTQNTLRAANAAYTYLFADGVHPTTGAHAVLADYVAAELVAPQYMSLLAETPLAFSDAQRGEIMDELAIDSTDADARTRVFATISLGWQGFAAQGYTPSTKNDGGTATIGFDYRVSPQISAGAALTYGDSHANFTDNAGKFRTQELLATLFGQYQFMQSGYVNAAVGFGGLDYRDIQRVFALGPLMRGEHGSTSGSDITGTITAGYWFGLDSLYQSLKIGPYLQGQYERVRVDGFGEDGSDSSAMTFGQQTREALIGEAGVRAQAVLRVPYATLSPYVQVAYDYDGDAEQSEVTGGLVTMNGTFTVPGYKPGDSWGTARVGLDARISEKVSAFASYSGRFGDDSQRYNSVNVGLKYNF